MHEAAWEVFVRRYLADQPFAGWANRLYPIDRHFFGAGMHYPSLFSPLEIGPYHLKHRLVMAPFDADAGGKAEPRAPAAEREYYAQRATPGGLIIAEASPVMATGHGNPGVPGIYSQRKSRVGAKSSTRLTPRRSDLSPALACRPCLAFLVPARRVLRSRRRRCRLRSDNDDG